ncbi:MAG: 6-bladed beta-propeller, partial [Bacteroidales bacterium]|nr:6-bladed beta-propeller [Bacteroidales bacterium]
DAFLLVILKTTVPHGGWILLIYVSILEAPMVLQMMKYKSIDTSLLGIVLFLMCSGCNPRTLDSVHSVDLSKPEDLSFYDYFSRYEIIPLETETGAMINYYRTEWKMYGGLHYLLNTRLHSLDIFDGEGHFLRQINHRGNGHGEYGEAYDFQINPFTGNLEILDPMRGIYVYNSTGEAFIEHFRAPILATHFFASLSEDAYVMFSLSRQEDCKMLFYSRSQNKIVGEAYPIPAFLLLNTVWHPMSNPFYRHDGELFFSQFHDGTIFRVNEDYTLEERFHWNFGRQSFQVERLPQNEEMGWYLDYMKRDSPKYATFFRYNAENSRYFINSFEYDLENYNLIYDKQANQWHLLKAFKEQLRVLPRKMDDDALYYLMPGMFVERWSRDNGGQLKFPSADEDVCYIVKYYFKKDE